MDIVKWYKYEHNNKFQVKNKLGEIEDHFYIVIYNSYSSGTCPNRNNFKEIFEFLNIVFIYDDKK